MTKEDAKVLEFEAKTSQENSSCHRFLEIKTFKEQVFQGRSNNNVHGGNAAFSGALGRVKEKYVNMIYLMLAYFVVYILPPQPSMPTPYSRFLGREPV